MVQLKVNYYAVNNWKDAKFQFQYGTIKRMLKTVFLHVFLDFNSNMVQLKACFKSL